MTEPKTTIEKLDAISAKIAEIRTGIPTTLREAEAKLRITYKFLLEHGSIMADGSLIDIKPVSDVLEILEKHNAG